jgi:hypothetical protein
LCLVLEITPGPQKRCRNQCLSQNILAPEGRQEAEKASPDWEKVVLGYIVSPLAYLEEGLVRPLLNVPNSAINKVITAGQHFDRSSQWLQQDEWGAASADALEGVVDLALAFLGVAALLDSLRFGGAPPGGPRPAPPAALAEEIPVAVPQELRETSLPATSASRASLARGTELQYINTGETLEKFDPEKLARIVKNLEGEGVTFQLNDSALDALGEYVVPKLVRTPYGTAHFGGRGTIRLPPDPSRLAVIHELGHLGQHRATLWDPYWGSTNQLIRLLEIANNRKLLQLRSVQWTRAEFEYTFRILELWDPSYRFRNLRWWEP